MSQVFPGRYTADPQGAEPVVFLIGMRFNKPWKISNWWLVFNAMPKMINYLARNPEVGLLGHHLWLGRTTILVSYWRSNDHLHAFATDRDAPHLAPWREYMRKIGDDGSVGIWHETYLIGPGETTSIYGNMPRFGLAAATTHVPAGGRRTRVV
ncbi:DUF4188 domain-containing protein [Pseudonocardiaceae bacterium YIM PH 21723]|nr:DUF4188 domain-containing protein [Pseudonocardiaceae bacterium YIM PH 21723]